MNANELAEEMDILDDLYCSAAATMLRQQQIAIEGLKAFYEDKLEAGRKREETLMKTVETLLKKAQEPKPAKYSDEWWKEVEEFNKQLRTQKK